MVAYELFEYTHQPLGIDRGVDLEMQQLAVEIVDDIEGAKASSAGQRIAHEIDRPDGVWQPWDVERNPFALRQAPLGRDAG